MSSGNPFRGSKADSGDYVQPATPKKSSKKKTKKVQIVSPHSSPTDNYKPTPRRLSDGGIGSPPPERNLEDDSSGSSDLESTATEDEYLERAIENTRRNSGSDPLSPPIPPSTNSSTGEIPRNPFAKGTRGVAPQVSFGLSTTRTKTNIDIDDENEGPRGEKGAAGPTMDVDAFKNMLLTGKVPVQAETANGQGEKSGNGAGLTDPGASTSKISIIESAHDLVPGSPPTAFDDRTPSDSEDYGGLDDVDETHDHSTLMGAGRSEDIAPALPPKQQPSGKAKKGPQTVSFADFEETIPPPDYGPASPEITRPDPAFWINRPPLDRHSSDLNKPLPPPPPPPSYSEQAPQNSAQGSSRGVVLETATLNPSPLTSTAVPQSSKKAAPPPPVSRRQGQGQVAGLNFSPQPLPGRSRGRSNSSMESANVEMRDIDQPIATPPTEPAAKSAAIPPPPPSRRQHNISLGLAEQTPPQTSEESLPISVEHRTSLSSSPKMTPNSKPMPPPPPRRNPSSKGRSTTVDRTPSSSSRNSLLQNEPTLGSHQASAPAPPPPRRGAGHGTASSNRSSLDINQRRASGQSVGSYQSQRSASPSSLQPLNHDEPSALVEGHDGRQDLPRDILADMSAFQKEIDELRAKAFSNA